MNVGNETVRSDVVTEGVVQMGMSLDNAVASLDGCEYRREGCANLFSDLKKSGIVAVFGASDDLMEFRGAISEELGASTAWITKDGILENECDSDDCPHFKRMKAKASTINPNFHDEGDPDGYAFTYDTDIPHMTFTVMEGDEKYCKGIVFYLKDVP